MSDANGKCDDCGRFFGYGAPGGTWAHKYDFVAMEQSHTHLRCPRCTVRLGPVLSNARPSDGNMAPYEGWTEDTGQ